MDWGLGIGAVDRAARIRDAAGVRSLRLLLLELGVLAIGACDSAPAPAVSEPTPAVEPEPPNECETLARLLVGQCSDFRPDTDRCAVYDEILGDHGAGRTLHYGTGELWFVAPDGYIFTDNDAARDLCPALPTVRDYDRARARKAAERARENDPTACSKADIEVAEIILSVMESRLGHFRGSGTKPTQQRVDEARGAGIEWAMEDFGLSRAKVEAAWTKVREVCPLAL